MSDETDMGSKGKGSDVKGGKGNCKSRELTYRVQMSQEYEEPELKTNVRRAYEERASYGTRDSSLVLLGKPFQCCQMQHFIKDEHFLRGLRDELLDLICYEKNNDLYKFHQTDDLRKVSTPHTKAIRHLIYNEFRAWMTEVTGITFTDRIDLTSSRYEYTDILLCHDDELDSRRIAFVLYLTPSWTRDDGGLLDLFDMDEHGQPKEVVESLEPSWNTMSWFEVTEASHHQVSEVVSKDKTRLSVHGWLHSQPVKRQPRYIEPLLEPLEYIHIEEEVVYEWLNPIYLDPEVQSQIREKFEADSEIELQGFLKEDKYQELTDCFANTKLAWSRQGPPNKRKYHFLPDEEMPDIVKKCIEFLRSEAMFLILSNLTGLRLHRLFPKSSDSDSELSESADNFDDVCTSEGDSATASGGISIEPGSSDTTQPEISAAKRPKLENAPDEENKCAEDPKESSCDPRCRYEVRRWQHGSYTLLHDTDLGGSEFALDALLFCSCRGWQKDYGGYTSYIAKGEDEELLTVFPAENALALVYRDKDTLKFVKHVNHRVVELPDASDFYDFSFVYYE